MIEQKATKRDWHKKCTHNSEKLGDCGFDSEKLIQSIQLDVSDCNVIQISWDFDLFIIVNIPLLCSIKCDVYNPYKKMFDWVWKVFLSD